MHSTTGAVVLCQSGSSGKGPPARPSSSEGGSISDSTSIAPSISFASSIVLIPFLHNGDGDNRITEHCYFNDRIPHDLCQFNFNLDSTGIF